MRMFRKSSSMTCHSLRTFARLSLFALDRWSTWLTTIFPDRVTLVVDIYKYSLAGLSGFNLAWGFVVRRLEGLA